MRLYLIDWIEVWLFVAAGSFLAGAFKANWKIGKLDLSPGWIGLAIWGFLAVARHLGN